MMEAMSIEKALLYEKFRLPYPDTLADDLLEPIGAIKTIADIGAGTGQLARLFVEKCETLYAIEPDASMRTVAHSSLKLHPNIQIVNATAEQTGLPAASMDLIVIGNAFHRFKAEAITEILRILKHTGWVAAISYSYTDSTFTEMIFTRLNKLEGLRSRAARKVHKTPVTDLFGEIQIQALNYTQSITEDWEAFWGAARSGIEAPEKHEPDFVQFEAINQEVFDTLCVDNRILITYETRVLFGQPKL
ncbi:MAG: hypothetical protein CL610_24705 [Anaerolineaceae bacterium]|nr:hypothetical protein [Anaerolineaceae bacterium]